MFRIDSQYEKEMGNIKILIQRIKSSNLDLDSKMLINEIIGYYRKDCIIHLKK